jgi:hypothetical protein
MCAFEAITFVTYPTSLGVVRTTSGAFYIFATFKNAASSKTIVRMAPTDLPLLFETSLKIAILADVARQGVVFG